MVKDLLLIPGIILFLFCLDWVPIVCCLWIKPGSKPNRKLETEQDRLPDNEVINQSNNQSIFQSIKQLIIFNYLTIWYYGENVRCLTFLKSSKRNLKSIQWILNQPTARGLRTTNKRIIFGSAKESAEMAERSSSWTRSLWSESFLSWIHFYRIKTILQLETNLIRYFLF